MARKFKITGVRTPQTAGRMALQFLARKRKKERKEALKAKTIPARGDEDSEQDDAHG